MAAAITVATLGMTAVKGLRVTAHDELVLERDGVRENRRFYLIDARDRLVNGKSLGALNQVLADYSHVERHLTLRFPDGRRVSGPVELGPEIATRFFSNAARARLVRGEFSEALSSHVGRPLRLVEPVAGGAVDRGRRGAVSLISQASLQQLARVAGEPSVDARRFRMLIEVRGTAAHEEDGWVGRRLRVGAAVVAVHGHVGRCLVTSRDAESGEVDLPTLDLLGSYRREVPSTEPLPFGVYGEVSEGGPVRVGDQVALLK